MRRHNVARLGAIALLVGGLAACGSDSDNNDDGGGGSSGGGSGSPWILGTLKDGLTFSNGNDLTS